MAEHWPLPDGYFLIMIKHGLYFSGTSNIVLPVKNKTYFPPEYQDKSRLAYYASLFNSVEINGTFYKMPLAKTIAKWNNQVPENFRFSFKLFQEVTHTGKKIFDLQHIPIFIDRINATGKKGCILVQLPPKFGIDLVQLGYLLTTLSPGYWPVAVEFRNSSWYTDEVFQLLRDHHAGLVLHDMATSATPLELTSAAFVYLRFHGPDGNYGGSYPDDFLAEYASYITEWMEEGKTVYVYFNNTMGNAVQNLVTLNKFVCHG